nr:hypothetical protein [Candidatus Sigynarchaeota archaeon]
MLCYTCVIYPRGNFVVERVALNATGTLPILRRHLIDVASAELRD